MRLPSDCMHPIHILEHSNTDAIRCYHRLKYCPLVARLHVDRFWQFVWPANGNCLPVPVILIWIFICDAKKKENNNNNRYTSRFCLNELIRKLGVHKIIKVEMSIEILLIYSSLQSNVSRVTRTNLRIKFTCFVMSHWYFAAWNMCEEN